LSSLAALREDRAVIESIGRHIRNRNRREHHDAA